MRTTINLDDELTDQLRKLAHLRQCSFTDALNSSIRLGLRREGIRKPFSTVPWESGFAPGVDPTRLNQLADELDDEEFVRKSKAAAQFTH